MTWTIGDDGVLQSYSGEIDGGSFPGPSEGTPIDSTTIHLNVLGSPTPITAPTPGYAVVVETLDIPEAVALG